MAKKTLLSGIRPTGELQIGNYFGAIKQFAKLQNTYNSFLMIADLHALTTIKDHKTLEENTLKIAALYIACGVNPKKTTIFVQSSVPQHTEMAILFGMITPLSMLELNPVYKEMLKENPKKRNLGLLSYPVLQAADILLYKTSIVPVGKDQAPHIELTREIARKFNSNFGHIFPEPKTIITTGAKIASLTEPKKKMSKSHKSSSYISLLDNKKTIESKIKGAVTDSGTEIKYSEKRPAISNLIMIYHLFSGKNIKEIENKYKGAGYKKFKEDLSKVINSDLSKKQKKYKELMKNKNNILKILKNGNKKAESIAKKTLKEVRQKIGLTI